MQIIEGNILDITEGIICHQVNCQGVFNTGLAKQIRKKYVKVFREYMSHSLGAGWQLGECQLIQVSDSLFISNLAGQDDYGNDGYCYTNYSYLKHAIEQVKALNDSNEQIYFPYGMGCGLAGGDWNIVSQIINEVVPNAIIVKLSRQN
jgi:O-acetyl-ADP-ribose deacetylase (regulator of RNase III)